MRHKWFRVGVGAFCVAMGVQAGAADIQTAGQLLIDLDAQALEGFTVGDAVLEWPNAGTLQPAFAHVNTHATETRPTYQIRDGAPCDIFLSASPVRALRGLVDGQHDERCARARLAHGQQPLDGGRMGGAHGE